MKELTRLGTILCLLIVANNTFSQVITKSFSSSVAGAVCPEIGIQYEVVFPSGYGVCQITWTITNGEKQSQTGNTVIVKWKDMPGAKGKVEASFISCSNSGNDGKSPTALEELILSVKNKDWESIPNSIPVNFCNPVSVVITMPAMVVEGTGGFNQPLRQEVGYAWTLPAGWKDFTTGNTGDFGTTTRSITIVPIGCAEPGTVKVKGGIDGCGSAAFSKTASILLTAVEPLVTVFPPSGYNGSTACNITPVTFTAVVTNAPGCSITSYEWTHTSSWTFDSQTGNTVTLRPTGAASDESVISCKVTFGCGSDRTGSFTPTFNPPVISGTSPVCSSSNFTVGNAQGLSITWASSNTSVATINSSGVLSPVGNASGHTTLNATLPCAVTVAPQTVWVGKPYDFLVEGATLVTAGSYNNYNMKKWGTPPNPIYLPFSEQGVGVNGFTWSFGLLATRAGWDCFSCAGEYISIKAGSSSSWVTARVENTCGITTRNYEVFVQQENCPPGGCEEPFIVYPNPSTEELLISSNSSEGINNVSCITLVDSNGSIVYKNEPNKTIPQIKIPVNEFKNGTYYLTVIQEGKAVKKQLVIKH